MLQTDNLAPIFLVFIFGCGFLCTLCMLIIDLKHKHDARAFEKNYPEFIKFRDKYKKMLSSNNMRIDIRAAKESIKKKMEDIQYYPLESEKYYLIKSEIEECRRFILDTENDEEKLNNEMYKFVVENKSVIDSIKEYDKEAHRHWMKVYEHAVKELEDK